MRIVCDTNVLVSGILFGGHARQILRQITRGAFTNCITRALLDEAEEVLTRPKFGLDRERAAAIADLFRDSFDIVESTRRVRAVKADPDDDRVLEAAEAGRATFLVSGDKHLLDLATWRGIRIVSPAAFVKEFIDTP